MTVALFSLASAGVFGVSTALTYLLPVKFARYGRSSTVAGLSNAFTYLGSALSGVGIGLLVGGFSWAVVCLLLCGLCAIGTLLSLFIRPTWNRLSRAGVNRRRGNPTVPTKLCPRPPLRSRDSGPY